MCRRATAGTAPFAYTRGLPEQCTPTGHLLPAICHGETAELQVPESRASGVPFLSERAVQTMSSFHPYFAFCQLNGNNRMDKTGKINKRLRGPPSRCAHLCSSSSSFSFASCCPHRWLLLPPPLRPDDRLRKQKSKHIAVRVENE